MASHDFCTNVNCYKCNREEAVYQLQRQLDVYRTAITKLKEIMPTLSTVDMINFQITLDILEEEMKKIK